MQEISKPTKKEIEKFAKDLEEVNTVIWNAICYTEELLGSNVYKTYENLFDEEERITFLKKIAKVYKDIEHNDDEFAQPVLNDAYFQDFDGFANELQEVLEDME